MHLELVICKPTEALNFVATIIQKKDFSTNGIPASYGEIIFLAITRSSKDIESDIQALIKMWLSETRRPGRKIKIEWIDSGTIRVP